MIKVPNSNSEKYYSPNSVTDNKNSERVEKLSINKSSETSSAMHEEE